MKAKVFPVYEFTQGALGLWDVKRFAIAATSSAEAEQIYLEQPYISEVAFVMTDECLEHYSDSRVYSIASLTAPYSQADYERRIAAICRGYYESGEWVAPAYRRIARKSVAQAA